MTPIPSHASGLACLAAAFLLGTPAVAAEFHVAPAGRDDHPGTEARPWATLAGARDGLRAWRAANPGNRSGPVTVWFVDLACPASDP